MSSDVLHVSRLFIHPIKSCAGIAVGALELDRRGAMNDRRYMVVDADGRFVSQRERPRMSGVRTTLTPRGIQVTADSMTPLTIVLPADGGGERRRVQIWDDSCDAVLHREGSAWFSDYLGDSFSLVRMPDDVERQVDPARARKGDLVGFADGFPLLLVGEASLSDLNGRLQAPVEVERFRPNLVVSGGEAFAEDAWTRLRDRESFASAASSGAPDAA